MFYNRDNPQWQFSEEQYLSREEYSRIVEEFNELCKSMLTVDVRDMNSKFYGIKEKGTPEQQEARRKKGIIGIICGIAIFAALIISLISKQILIFGYIACVVMLFAGISIAISGRGEIVESTSKAFLNRIMGSGIAIASLLILLLIIFRSNFGEAEFFILIFVLVFGIAGLVLLVVSILKAVSGKLIYTREVNAVCSGYVRYVNRESGENHGSFTFICTSPLFSYSVDGVQYEAVWDEFVTKEDSDIALGQSVPIKVDPRHPENIMSPVMTHPGALVFKIFMSLACIGVAVGMGIYVAAGAAEGMTVETKWNPVVEKLNGVTESTRTQVTDEMIESLYVDKLDIPGEWYYEIGVVDTVTYSPDGQIVSYTDKAINSVLYTDGSAPEPGTVMLLYYTVDKEYLEYGKGYKRTFASGDPDKFEYVGSHSAYVAE